MTDRIALGLGLLIVAIFAADFLHYHWDLHLFIGRQLVNLVQYLAFWR